MFRGMLRWRLSWVHELSCGTGFWRRYTSSQWMWQMNRSGRLKYSYLLWHFLTFWQKYFWCKSAHDVDFVNVRGAPDLWWMLVLPTSQLLGNVALCGTLENVFFFFFLVSKCFWFHAIVCHRCLFPKKVRLYPFWSPWDFRGGLQFHSGRVLLGLLQRKLPDATAGHVPSGGARIRREEKCCCDSRCDSRCDVGRPGELGRQCDHPCAWDVKFRTVDSVGLTVWPCWPCWPIAL